MRKAVSGLFLTLMMMCSVCSADIGFGDSGYPVLDAQLQLASLGYYTGDVIGKYDRITAEAVRKFQVDNKLTETGSLDQETYKRLLGKELPDFLKERKMSDNGMVFRSGSDVSLIRRLISTAMGYQGVPYVFGGTSPGGFDCSGFVQHVFQKAGIGVPRMADEQYVVSRKTGVPVTGDLVFFSTYAPGVSHVGIYIGDNQFVHASSSRGVTVSSLKEDYWAARYVGAGTVLS